MITRPECFLPSTGLKASESTRSHRASRALKRRNDGRPGDLPAERPYPDHNLRFAFAAPRYDAPEGTHYRVRLDGLDDDWSAWTHETDKDYTNLWEGRYVFRVQARDVYGFVSREDTFTFRIPAAKEADELMCFASSTGGRGEQWKEYSGVVAPPLKAR